jgi:hypothetical protein
MVVSECRKLKTYGEISMEMNRLKHLYVEELKDLYNGGKPNGESPSENGQGSDRRGFARSI